MPEFLQRRFQSRWIRTYLTVVALISYVFTKTSVRCSYVTLRLLFRSVRTFMLMWPANTDVHEMHLFLGLIIKKITTFLDCDWF